MASKGRQQMSDGHSSITQSFKEFSPAETAVEACINLHSSIVDNFGLNSTTAFLRSRSSYVLSALIDGDVQLYDALLDKSSDVLEKMIKAVEACRDDATLCTLLKCLTVFADGDKRGRQRRKRLMQCNATHSMMKLFVQLASTSRDVSSLNDELLQRLCELLLRIDVKECRFALKVRLTGMLLQCCQLVSKYPSTSMLTPNLLTIIAHSCQSALPNAMLASKQSDLTSFLLRVISTATKQSNEVLRLSVTLLYIIIKTRKNSLKIIASSFTQHLLRVLNAYIERAFSEDEECEQICLIVVGCLRIFAKSKSGKDQLAAAGCPGLLVTLMQKGDFSDAKDLSDGCRELLAGICCICTRCLPLRQLPIPSRDHPLAFALPLDPRKLATTSGVAVATEKFAEDSDDDVNGEDAINPLSEGEEGSASHTANGVAKQPPAAAKFQRGFNELERVYKRFFPEWLPAERQSSQSSHSTLGAVSHTEMQNVKSPSATAATLVDHGCAVVVGQVDLPRKSQRRFNRSRSMHNISPPPMPIYASDLNGSSIGFDFLDHQESSLNEAKYSNDATIDGCQNVVVNNPVKSSPFRGERKARRKSEGSEKRRASVVNSSTRLEQGAHVALANGNHPLPLSTKRLVPRGRKNSSSASRSHKQPTVGSPARIPLRQNASVAVDAQSAVGTGEAHRNGIVKLDSGLRHSKSNSRIMSSSKMRTASRPVRANHSEGFASGSPKSDNNPSEKSSHAYRLAKPRFDYSPEAYFRNAMRTISVVPFVKIAYPDLHNGYPNLPLQPLKLFPSALRARIFKEVEMSQSQNTSQAFPPKVVFDLDSLLSVETVPSVIQNSDDSIVGVKDASSDSLKFESRFESGNLRKAIQTGPLEYDLLLTPDINQLSMHYQWFFFEVSNMEADVPYYFNIVNFVKSGSQFSEGMQPVVFSVTEALAGRPGWARSGCGVTYYRNRFYLPFTPTDNKLKTSEMTLTFSTLSFSISFRHKYDVCYVAYHFPYTFTTLECHLAELDKAAAHRDDLYYRKDVLCNTLAGNPVHLLTLTAAGTTDEIAKRRYVFLSARIHPGETNASWMMLGSIRHLLSAKSRDLLERFVFKIVPMLNPDGVINGSHRCSLSGQDLNRQWLRPNEQIHPSIFHTKGLLEYLCAVGRRPYLFCDYHGHSRKKNVFLLGNDPNLSWIEEDKKFGHSRDFLKLPKLLDKVAPGFSFKCCKFAIEKGKEGTSRIVAWRQLGLARAYTLEGTFCGFDKGQYRGNQVGTKELIEMGERFCAAILLLRDQELESKQKLGSSDDSEFDSDSGEILNVLHRVADSDSG